MLDYLEDVASDLSAFHRVDDWRALDGPRFFSLCHRLAAYAGVMQARVVAEQEAASNGPQRGASGGNVARVPEEVALAGLVADGWLERREG